MFLHVFTSRHFYNMIGYFVGAAALTLLLGFGVEAAGLMSGAGAALIIGIVGLVFGLGATIALRALFGLMQTGRILQYVSFFLGSWLGVALAALLISTLVVTHAWLAGLVVFAVAFGAATATGEVPIKGRTWLPMRMPKRS